MKLRFVKFLTSRGNEIEKKKEGMKLQCLPSFGQATTTAPALALLPPSFHSLPTRPTNLPPPPPQLPLRHGSGEQYSPAISPSCSAPPFLLYKLPKRKSGREEQLLLFWPAGPASLPSYRGAQLAALMPSRWPACSPPFSLSPVSRCGSSTSSEAIGKQRPRMRFPVSFPPLTNK